MIGKGSKVKIQSRENKIGIVLEVKDDFVQVNYQNKTEWFPISDLLESTNELLSRLIKNDIDDEINFVLAMDAYRLHTAQLWDPYVFASSSVACIEESFASTTISAMYFFVLIESSSSIVKFC